LSADRFGVKGFIPMKETGTKKDLRTIGKELIQPFLDLTKTTQALTGINISYILEGITYFGVVGLLAIYFNQYIGLNDIQADLMVGIQTAGITLAMFLLGAAVDWIGVRKAILISLTFMLFGRIVLAAGPAVMGTRGMGSSAYWAALLGILGIIIGYGIYQPACYTAVRKFTSEKNAAMGYAMLYALMNLGGFLPGLISPPVRRGFGIVGVFWVYVALTAVGMIAVAFLITRRASQKAEKEAEWKGAADKKDSMDEMTAREKLKYYVAHFPLKDARFLYFIFILIPVQTLFAHNWLTLPQYTSRAFTGFVKNNFEFFVNFNPILIFILTPMIAALTSSKHPYKMMILGTSVMALSPFILVPGPNITTLFLYLIINTIGEAMWQPRFLQWVAEIAPKNMTGIYMGIGQFPWFLTKFFTSLYAGWFLSKYCPAHVPPGAMHTEFMWFIYGLIAIVSPIGLILVRKWMFKGFKTKHEG
jgi:POT family proton-dependent oligopeptide transporter